MNEIKIIKEYFNFLLENKFLCKHAKDNLEHSVFYTKYPLEIAITFDVRESKIFVGLLDLSAEKPYFTYTLLEEANIASINKIKTLNDAINDIYCEGNINKHKLKSLLSLYADFIKENLDTIFHWKYFH